MAIVTGTTGNDFINQSFVDPDGDSVSDADDVVFADPGNDTVFGLGGDDVLDGHDGDDTLIGGPGADDLFGGSDTDTASYATSAVGVTVNLVTGVGSGGDAAGDMLNGIENLTGSDLNDILVGDSSANRLVGGLGNDVIFGDGFDFILGGDGIDTVSFQNSPAAVSINLLSGGSVQGVESVVGSAFNDTIRGDDGNNKFKFIGKDDFSDKKGELRYEDKGSKVIVQGDVNGDGRADFEIFVAAGSLAKGDFVL